MMRPVLALLTAVAMLLQAITGIAVARAEYVAAPICHAGGGHAPTPGDTSHDCLVCPIRAAMAQPAVIVPPIPTVPRSGRIATIALAVRPLGRPRSRPPRSSARRSATAVSG